MSEPVTFFRKALLYWYKPDARPMPWKGESNPYLIWLSEIILQQTRVEQGWDYYLKFKNKYPTVFDLARVSQDELLKDWQGLGYYSRANNLHQAAKYIVEHYNGKFPDNYKDILALKGVGTYTAAAIASFAYQLPYAVVDGNVIRIWSRYEGVEIPTDTKDGKRRIQELAEQGLDRENPGIYNQAIMDFGATVCKPKNPFCKNCPLQINCKAFSMGKVEELPIKSKKIKRKKRYFNYLIIKKNTYLFLEKRNDKDIWKNLYQFPLIETREVVEDENINDFELKIKMLVNANYNLINKTSISIQKLTHRDIITRFFMIELSDDNYLANRYLKIEKEALKNFAFPKIIQNFIKDNGLYF